MEIDQALTIMESLTKDCINSISTLGEYGDEIAIALYEEIKVIKEATKPCTNYEQMLVRMTRPLPIESAPKDGAYIDIFDKYTRITDVKWNEKEQCFMRSGIKCNGATHWLPIPQVKVE